MRPTTAAQAQPQPQPNQQFQQFPGFPAYIHRHLDFPVKKNTIRTPAFRFSGRKKHHTKISPREKTPHGKTTTPKNRHTKICPHRKSPHTKIATHENTHLMA
jgi:hypothetical protein